MASTHVFPDPRAYILPDIRLGLFRDVAAEMFYFTLAAFAFVFVLSMIMGAHP